MAKNLESQNFDPDNQENEKSVGKKKNNKYDNQQRKDDSVEVFKDGMNMTPESWAYDQKKKEHLSRKDAIEAEIAADKAEIEKIKVKAELKKAQEQAGSKEEVVVMAEAAGEKPKDAKEAEKVLEEKVEEIVEELTDIAPEAANVAAQNGQITPEQNVQIQTALKSPQARGRIKNFFYRMKDSATWGTISGLAASVAVKGGIRALGISALGPSLPVILGVGAIAGSSVETVRAILRESQKYHLKENLDKLENEPDQFKKAAILNKLEEAYADAKISGSQEELELVGQALHRARVHLETYLHSQDAKFENESDKDKLMFLMRVSNASRASIDRSTKREAKQLLKDMERSLSFERKFSHLKGRWGKVGWSALKGAVFGTIGAGVGYAATNANIGPNAWNGLKSALGYSTPEHTAVAASLVKNGGNEIKEKLFSEKIGSKGITKAAREMIRDYIIQQRTINPDFTSGIKIPNLVYAEDYLKDRLLEQGVSTTGGVLRLSGAEIQAAIDKAMALDDKGAKSIEKLVSGGKHFLSEATRQNMMNWQPGDLANPDNNVINSLVKEAQDKVLQNASGEVAEKIFSGDRNYADLMTLLITNALIEEGLDQGQKKLRRDEASEAGFRPFGQKGDSEEVASTSKETKANTKSGLSSKPENFSEHKEPVIDFKALEKYKKAMDQKLRNAGVPILETGLVWDDKEDIKKQIPKVDEILDRFIESFKKNSGPGQLQPVILEFNMKKEMLKDVESRTINTGGQDMIFLRIPSHHKADYYDKNFKEFFKEFAVSPQPDLDSSGDTESSNVKADGNAELKRSKDNQNATLNKESAHIAEEFKKKHDYLTTIDFSREVLDDGKIDLKLVFNRLDEILSRIKESGKLEEESFQLFKELHVVKEVPRSSERKAGALYIKVPFRYQSQKDKDTMYWMILRNIENLKHRGKTKQE